VLKKVGLMAIGGIGGALVAWVAFAILPTYLEAPRRNNESSVAQESSGETAPSRAKAAVWFARAGAVGDGTSAASPIGSSAALDAATKPGDVIILEPGEAPFDGGVALKKGQTLIGLPDAGRKPSITNTKSDLHGGNGVVLADESRVLNVRIVHPKASGVLGVNVSGISLSGVEVEDANTSAGLTDVAAKVLGPIAHGGIVFIATEPGKTIENYVLRCDVTNAAGVGVGSFALGGARSRLFVGHTRTTGGTLVPPLLDVGMIALAEGRSSESHLELADTTINGRMGQQGRNVIAFATADGKTTVRVERSTLGEVGQDGIVAVVAMVPATVAVAVRDSTIEKAGQTNIEGSILNLPASDRVRAHESVIAIDVEGSIIRDAGAVGGFRNEAQNVWLGPTYFDQSPFAKGRYRLSVRSSVVQNAIKNGIGIGNTGSEFKIAPDEGEYDVRLRDNTITGNGSAEISIAAAKARIDARQNSWGRTEGLAEARVLLLEQAKRTQLDASQPLPPKRGTK
jgi:hypothetical protein